MLSADKIVWALKKNKTNVLLHKGTPAERDCVFTNENDNYHCLGILTNQINLIQKNMADMNRMYSERELYYSYNKLLDTPVT